MKPTYFFPLAVLACAWLAFTGCTTAGYKKTTTTTTTPQSTNSTTVTEEESVSSLLTTVQGFKHSKDADGATSTSMDNYASDTQAINALGSIITTLIANGALASNNSNSAELKAALSEMKTLLAKVQKATAKTSPPPNAWATRK